MVEGSDDAPGSSWSRGATTLRVRHGRGERRRSPRAPHWTVVTAKADVGCGRSTGRALLRRTELPEDHAAIDVPEAEAGLRHDSHVWHSYGGVGDTLGVGGERGMQVLAVDRSVEKSLVELEHGRNALDAARCTERVADERLGRVHQWQLRGRQAQRGAPVFHLVWVGERGGQVP